MSRFIRLEDVSEADRYAWNDATGEFRVYYPKGGDHAGFWIRGEASGHKAFARLLSPGVSLVPGAEDQLKTWNHEDGCDCGYCSEAT
jgi:catechol 2,3-dioxygenase-like lactoylglutathione lyase family enzyme